jgi:hypothetical protein
MWPTGPPVGIMEFGWCSVVLLVCVSACTAPGHSRSNSSADSLIEYCESNGAIGRVGPLTCILSPGGGEDTGEGDSAESL